jgi:hypothetical protein
MAYRYSGAWGELIYEKTLIRTSRGTVSLRVARELCLVAVLALGQIRQVNGGGAVALHVQVQVLHELNVVHEHLLADVALERHVRLEFSLQELRFPLKTQQAGCFRARNYGRKKRKPANIFKKEKILPQWRMFFFFLSHIFWN